MEDDKKPGLFGALNSWWSKPFNSNGTALDWVLFVGVIVIATFLWQLILLEFTKEVV